MNNCVTRFTVKEKIMRTITAVQCVAIVITLGCAVVHRAAAAEEGESKAKVTGIGGVFLLSQGDPRRVPNVHLWDSDK